MNDYFKGKRLYGDDFSLEQIKKWYEEETEGYSSIIGDDYAGYFYEYDELNKYHGFNKIQKKNFKNVLGFGSAWGNEFESISEFIENITIIEPSDHLISKKIGKITPKYMKPNISGKLDFPDNSFDLITSFGALHHVPNVTYIINELVRVLKPGGYFLTREPIISMGDWRENRVGVTKNERGIPVKCFDEIFNQLNVSVESKSYCMTINSAFERTIGLFLKRPTISYRWFVVFDKFISNLLKFNVKYYAKIKIRKIAPQSIFYVIKKNNLK